MLAFCFVLFSLWLIPEVINKATKKSGKLSRNYDLHTVKISHGKIMSVETRNGIALLHCQFLALMNNVQIHDTCLISAK